MLPLGYDDSAGFESLPRVLHVCRIYLEVKGDEGEDEALKVLDKVVEDAQPFWVIALLDVQQRPDLGAL